MSKDSCILELASQLASLKAHDEIFKMEKIELENKITERLTVALMQERERWQNELMKREFET